MFILDWYREYLNIKIERAARLKELEYCESCETLKLQLALANDERKMLIAKLTDKSDEPEEKIDTTTLKPIMPSRVNWNTKRQMLEAESRAAAKVLRTNEANKDSNSGKALTLHEIEKELGVANEG